MIIHDAEQNTPEWFAARIGKPSASNASRMITSTGARSKSLEKYAMYLAGCVFAERDIEQWDGNKYTERGHEVEDEARSAYSMLFDAEVEQVGFCTTDDGRYGASPDGLCDGRRGAVEIKCLPKEHIPTLIQFQRTGKISTSWRPQVQMQILVCGLDWVDSFFYQPDLPFLRVRHKPDETIQRGLQMFLAETIAKRDEYLAILREF